MLHKIFEDWWTILDKNDTFFTTVSLSVKFKLGVFMYLTLGFRIKLKHLIKVKLGVRIKLEEY